MSYLEKKHGCESVFGRFMHRQRRKPFSRSLQLGIFLGLCAAVYPGERFGGNAAEKLYVAYVSHNDPLVRRVRGIYPYSEGISTLLGYGSAGAAAGVALGYFLKRSEERHRRECTVLFKT